MRAIIPILSLLLLAFSLLLPGRSQAATSKKQTTQKKPSVVRSSATARNIAAKPATRSSAVPTKSRAKKPAKRVASGPWKEPTYADSTEGDFIDGDDLTVRRAAVEAMGPLNGTVVVTDASTGRVLTVVNQKVAYKDGFQPCSTVKIPVALAALSENLIERDTAIRLYGRTSMAMTQATATSNNPYFASLGTKLGFDRVSYYAKLFGLGEKAGLGIEGERAGTLPAAPPKNGGVGMMSSFGEGITLTPLQLAALMGAIANGGTLYYLQYPRSQKELEDFIPRVKRQLDIAHLIPEIKPGMMGAVEFGTARRAAYDPNEPIYGKTGTCTDARTPTHLGWFGSFNDTGRQKLAVVVLLTGGRPVNGPVASGVAGDIYKSLSRQNYFAQSRTTSPVGLIQSGISQ